MNRRSKMLAAREQESPSPQRGRHRLVPITDSIARATDHLGPGQPFATAAAPAGEHGRSGTVNGLQKTFTGARQGVALAPAPDVPAASPTEEQPAEHAQRMRALMAVAGRPPRAGSTRFGMRVRPIAGIRSAARLKAWMVVLPVDALALSAPAVWMPEHAKGFLAMAALSMLLLTGGGRYRARLHISVLDELPIILGRLLAAGAIVATAFALRHQQDQVTAFLATAVVAMGLVVGGRVLTNQLILIGRRRRIVAHRTVIVGGGVLGAELAGLLERYPQYGLYPVGFVDDGDQFAASAVSVRLGGVDDLEQVVLSTGADVVIIADGEISEWQLLDLLRRPAVAHCDFMIVPRMHQFCRHTGIGDHIGSIPVMRILTSQLKGPGALAKRAVDVVVSAGLLIICAPLLLACALAVRIEGGPGVLFRQERVGRDGHRFMCLKFRSMRPATTDEAATRWSIARDSRVGPVGKLLRRTGVDELPQLWNILRGDMTLIGPRPERPFFVTKFTEEVPHYRHRHRVRAGLTGLAQVSGLRGDVPIADRARFDNYYIENWSLWLDVKILLRTVAEVVFARGR